MTTKPGAAKTAIRSPRDAVQTRARILEAAKMRFSRESFDHVGVRDIAADAGVDAALINRYFGSKEKLFTEVITGVFRTEKLMQGEVSELGMRFARHIMSEEDESGWRDDLDPLLLLLRSATSPKASSIVAQLFHAEFVDPLARALEGDDTDLRAGLFAALIIGLATMRVAFNSPLIKESDIGKISACLGKMIQACTDGEDTAKRSERETKRQL